MANENYEFIFTPTGGSALTLNKNTSVPRETAGGIRWKPIQFCGIHGERLVNMGRTSREVVISGQLHEASEADLQTAKDAFTTAAQSKVVGTLSLRGGKDSWANSVIYTEPEFTDHYFDPNGAAGCTYAVVFRQLVVA